MRNSGKARKNNRHEAAPRCENQTKIACATIRATRHVRDTRTSTNRLLLAGPTQRKITTPYEHGIARTARRIAAFSAVNDAASMSRATRSTRDLTGRRLSGIPAATTPDGVHKKLAREGLGLARPADQDSPSTGWPVRPLAPRLSPRCCSAVARP